MKTFANCREILDMSRIFGMENCSPTTWPSSTTCDWACVSVNVFSERLVFVGVNHVQLLPSLTLRSSGHIKKTAPVGKKKGY